MILNACIYIQLECEKKNLYIYIIYSFAMNMKTFYDMERYIQTVSRLPHDPNAINTAHTRVVSLPIAHCVDMYVDFSRNARVYWTGDQCWLFHEPYSTWFSRSHVICMKSEALHVSPYVRVPTHAPAFYFPRVAQRLRLLPEHVMFPQKSNQAYSNECIGCGIRRSCNVTSYACSCRNVKPLS